MIGASDRMTARLRQLLAACLIVLVPLSIARTASAQAVTGTILGTVADTTGAVLPGVTVTVKHTETGLTRTLVTDSNGEYTAASIPTGTYTVTGEISGFKSVSLSNVQVGVDQRVRADIKLEVGAMTESVEIVAQTPLVQTSSSDLSTTVTEEQMKRLPLNGRNFVSLTRLIPGVLRGIPARTSTAPARWRGAPRRLLGQRSASARQQLHAGRRRQQRDVAPDGGGLPECRCPGRVQAPDQHLLGGVRPVARRRGQHPDQVGLEPVPRQRLRVPPQRRLRRQQLLQQPRRAAEAGLQNQFGGTLGGPIYRNKTFFFGDYQGLRLEAGTTRLSTVPTLKMRNGDFSEISRVIYDPLTQQPFPGNIIPRNRFDPASANVIAQLYPEPNTAGTIAANGRTSTTT